MHRYLNTFCFHKPVLAKLHNLPIKKKDLRSILCELEN